MTERNQQLEQTGILSGLRKQCAGNGSGMVLDTRTSPEIVNNLPGHLQKCITDKGSVIIDSAGNVFSQPNTNGKQ